MKNHEEFEIVQKHSGDLSAEENAQLDTLNRTAFPDVLDWSIDDGQADESLNFLGKISGKIVSNVGMIKRTILVGDQNVVVGGIGGVATLPEYRQRGFAGKLLKVAEGFMRNEGGFEFSFLFCPAEKVEYYSRCGYFQVHNPVYVREHGERKKYEELKLVMPLTELGWPDGEVDLMGPSW